MNLALIPEIRRELAAGAPLAVGVSGGKDSQAAALAVAAGREALGHTGEFILVHADLGRVEWAASLSVCQRLADHLDVELITVRRPAGGLMERWESRWESSVRRYGELRTMCLVLPWSTPKMRFCTSELKTDPINAALRKRAQAAGEASIISACGIRREESFARRFKPVARLDTNASTQRVSVWNWNPIIEWSAPEVFDCIARSGLELHEAYTKHGMTRLSCRFCIMASLGDLRSAATAAENAPLFREIVALETRSTFPFHGQRWLADVAPELLGTTEAAAVVRAKEGARLRAEAEAEIPTDLLHGAGGWPRRMPSAAEADSIAVIRQRVAAAVGLEAIGFLDGATVHARFAELLSQRASH